MTYKELKEAIDKLTLEQQNINILVDITGEKAIIIELRVFERTEPSVELFADWDV